MSSPEPTTTSKVVVALTTMAAGLAAQKAVALGWRAVRGSTPGRDDSPLPELLAFAALSAAAVAVAKSWATNRHRVQLPLL